VERLRPDAARPGEIVDQEGRALGRHDGVIHFTVGQRKGLGLSGNGAPLFVLKLDAAQARVVVGPREALRIRTIVLTDVNWLMSAPADAFECAVKVRSTRPPVAARVTPSVDGGASVELLGHEDAVAPGQACVFYANDGTRVLGGGWIARAEPARKVA
jgi:tRNA-specific 2-thiouridylase